MSIAATIATNRFGLGARPGELKRASVNPRLWLLQQLDQQESLSFNQDLPSSHDTGMKLTEYRAIKIKNQQDAVKRPSTLTAKFSALTTKHLAPMPLAKPHAPVVA